MRLSSIEGTLRLLLNQRIATPQTLPQNEDTSPHAAAYVADPTRVEDVAMLGENQEDFLVDSEDVVDGMATIAESTGKDSRVFGTQFDLIYNLVSSDVP